MKIVNNKKGYSEMVYCNKCNAEIIPVNGKCPICGLNLKDLELDSDANNNENINDIYNSRDYVKIFLIIVGIILIILGINFEVPSREFNIYKITEYVGGDAFNGIIEASIRGGEIAGAMITKAICICSGFIIIALGCLKSKTNKID